MSYEMSLPEPLPMKIEWRARRPKGGYGGCSCCSVATTGGVFIGVGTPNSRFTLLCAACAKRIGKAAEGHT